MVREILRERERGQLAVTPVKHFLSEPRRGRVAAVAAAAFGGEVTGEEWLVFLVLQPLSQHIPEFQAETTGHRWASWDLWDSLHLLLFREKNHSSHRPRNHYSEAQPQGLLF